MTADRLYNLLPAIYRIRDYTEGEPLRALLTVLERELAVLETDIGDLYDQWFIETCAEWVVPYIGDLLDVQELYTENARLSTFGSQERRAFVANTLAYRRRKGTAPVLEQLTRDLTGWQARVVEVFNLLTTTQNLDHRRDRSSWVDVRQSNRPDRLGTPFEQQAAYTPEIRRADRGQGRYNLRSISLFVWRLQSYPVYRSTPRLIGGTTARSNDRRCYTFDPIGGSFSLFNQPQPEIEITRLADEVNVPGKLRRMALADELQVRAQRRSQGEPLSSPSYFGAPNPPVLQVFINGQTRPIPADEMLIARLDPPVSAAAVNAQNPTWEIPSLDSNPQFPAKVVAIDPEQGRLAFLDRTVPSRVEVSYAYGFSGDVGSGPYEHSDPLMPDQPIPECLPDAHPLLTWEIEQDSTADANPLATAVDLWNRTVEAWESLRRQSSLPLARLVLDPASISSLISETSRPQCTPGILKGLTVTAPSGTKQISLDPGVAIDGQGRRIELPQTITLETANLVNKVSSGSIAVVLAYRAAQDDCNWQLQILPTAAFTSYPAGSCVLLAHLTIDPQSHQIQEVDLTDRVAFTPGILNGLTVVLKGDTPPVPSPILGIRHDRGTPAMTAVITAGIAVDVRGRAIAITHNRSINLRPHQGKTVWLVAAYQVPRLGKPDWKVIVVSDANIQKFSAPLYVPLAHLSIPTVAISEASTTVQPAPQPNQPLPNPQLPMRVNPGIVRGLTVTGKIGDAGVTVAPGIAIDPQANIMQSDIQYRVNLRRYANQTVLLVMSAVDAPRQPRWRLQAIPVGAPEAATGIALAQLTLNRWGRLAKLPDTAVRQWCNPGIVRGLEVTCASTAAQVGITPGVALTRDRQLITLEHACQVDLSAYPDRTLTLFIADQAGSGLPRLQVVSPKMGQDWQAIGIVPEETSDAKTGMITIKDHRTYKGDLTLTMPTLKQLWLRSTGTRPHIQGNLTIQGISSQPTEPHQAEPGTLSLDGLLIEGQVTVLAGNLNRLNILHSTLVPSAGGLVVEPAVLATTVPDEAEITNRLIALVMYWINQIQRMIGIGSDVSKRSPRENWAELVAMARQQILQVFATTQQVLRRELKEPCLSSGKESDSSALLHFPYFDTSAANSEGTDQLNDRLNIRLYRSICGAIHLTDTVPTLSITDSIVDRVNPTSETAIVAPGSTVEINTTTVFGSTTVSSLEASNSIFMGKVMTQRRQIGCLRFCYLPENSHTPRRYRCQPDLALSAALDRLPAPITALAIDPGNSRMFMGTAGNGIFRSADQGQTWIPLPELPANLHITGLFAPVNLDATFDPALPPETPVTRPSQTVLYAGVTGGGVLRSPNGGNTWSQLQTVFSNTDIVALVSYAQPGLGTIASSGTRVTGANTQFTQLTVGDSLTAARETRTIAKIHSNTVLELNALLSGDLPPGTPFTTPVILAGTAGDGVFRGSDTSQSQWIDLNQGLSHRQLTGLAVSLQGRVFASTAGGGVFRLLGNENRWVEVNTGLHDREITTLAIDADGRLFVGTQSGHICRSTNHGNLWIQVYSGVAGVGITSLLAYTQAGTGTITSEGTQVTGSGTQFQCPSKSTSAVAQLPGELPVGSTIRVQNQSRIVTALTSEKALVINAAFDTDLSTATPFRRNLLLAGTANGKILQSIDNGKQWSETYHDMTQTDITCLALNPPTQLVAGTLVAGTSVGNLLIKQGDRWLASNRGLINVDEKMLILDRLQPQFTSCQQGDPGYAQLSLTSASEIRTGAEDGSEMGTFNYLQQPQQEAALRASLEEYIRFGLELGIFYIT